MSQEPWAISSGNTPRVHVDRRTIRRAPTPWTSAPHQRYAPQTPTAGVPARDCGTTGIRALRHSERAPRTASHIVCTSIRKEAWIRLWALGSGLSGLWALGSGPLGLWALGPGPCGREPLAQSLRPNAQSPFFNSPVASDLSLMSLTPRPRPERLWDRIGSRCSVRSH